jgi:hypothetical protein
VALEKKSEELLSYGDNSIGQCVWKDCACVGHAKWESPDT